MLWLFRGMGGRPRAEPCETIRRDHQDDEIQEWGEPSTIQILKENENCHPWDAGRARLFNVDGDDQFIDRSQNHHTMFTKVMLQVS